MVADDEFIIRMDIIEELRNAGFSVVGEAADGFDAIECCREKRPDVALIDINMPIIDGMNVARTILAENLVEAVVLITAYNDESTILEAGSIGVGGYIVKPLRENSVIPAIYIALAQSRHLRNANASADRARQDAEDRRIVDRAKSILAEQMKCSEGEALRRMQKESMRKGCRLVVYANTILQANTDGNIIQEAKSFLMKKYHLSENAAFHKIRERSERMGISLQNAARQIVQGE